MPTIAPGTDARCMPAGIALSSAAARWSAGLDALLGPARSPPANMVVIATARRRRSVSLLFIFLPPTQPVGFTPLRLLLRPSNHCGQLSDRSLFCGTALGPPMALAPTFHWLPSGRLWQWEGPHDILPPSA